MTFSASLAGIETLMLISIRVIAFLVTAPPFSYRAFPASVRMILAIGLSFAVFGSVQGLEQELATGPYILAMVLEAFVGVSLGFLVYIVFTAVQIAGGFIDQMGGFAMAQSFDPLNMVNSAPISRLFHMTALALMFASNAHLVILDGLFKTFAALPLGKGILLGGVAHSMTAQITDMFVAALQVAGPLLIVLLLEVINYDIV